MPYNKEQTLWHWTGSTADETERLTGKNLKAIADKTEKYAVPNELLPSMPFGYKHGIETPEQAIAAMKSAGDGATGAVVIKQPSGVSHAISVVNRNGEVYFIDAQIGQVVKLNPNLNIQLGIRYPD